MSVIQRACDDVYSSFASSAFASASTVETNVRSRLSYVLGALDRELRLVREPDEQRKLALVELTVADGGGQRGNAVALELERRDDDTRDAPSRP